MKFSAPDWRNTTQNKKDHITSVKEVIIYGLLIVLICSFITFRFVVPMITKGLFTVN